VALELRSARNDDWIIDSARGTAVETLEFQKEKARRKHRKLTCFDYEFADGVDKLKGV
jgi:hypothetical protein